LWREVLDGIRYIKSQQEIGFIFVVMSILFAAAGAIYIVIIVFIQQAFHSVTKDLGFLAVPLGIGLFLGSLSYGRWGAKAGAFKTIFWSLILGGTMTILFSSCVEGTHSRPLAMVLSLIFGFVIGPIAIASNTVINQVSSREMSGKIFAALEFVMHAAFILTMLASSMLAERIPRIWILISVGFIFLLVGVIGLIRMRKEPQ
jgi:MFS family permease